ncbi:MAG: YggS family pyridoxal phosphate-dependent enzyme, partial [Atopobium sp.]|nr:YggS family pyridoxal phosphate-dependent enzyme [Atopobium sp.]
MTYDSGEYLEFIKARRAQIESLVADAAKKSGRSASEIEIVAVSKTVP